MKNTPGYNIGKGLMKPMLHPRDGLTVKLFARYITLDNQCVTSDLDDNLFVI